MCLYSCLFVTDQWGYTGLMLASCEGYADIVSKLLEAKADPNITDEVKFNYFMHTSCQFLIHIHIRMAKLLYLKQLKLVIPMW